MSRTFIRIAAVWGVAAVCVGYAEIGTASAQQISGVVIEASDRLPVPDAAVTIVDSAGVEVIGIATDSFGIFSSPLPHAGAYALRVEKLGYRTLVTDALEVGNDETVELEVRLGIDAIPLDPVQVTARRRVARPNPVFERRLAWGRQSGFGRFFTRDEIEETAVLRTSSLLSQVPALRLVQTTDGRVYLAPTSRTGGVEPCRSVVYLNGAEVSQLMGLDEFALDQLEGIEVYRWRARCRSR